jgi:uncharacterized protein YdbL (DUF1318 family)
MKKSLFILCALMVLLALPAQALELHAARQAGVVGEGNDGYIVVLQPSAAATALASEINQKRRQEYSRISAENGQPTEVVAKLAVPQIIKNLEKSARFQDETGAWQTH